MGNHRLVKPARLLPRVGLCSLLQTNAVTGGIVLAAVEVKLNRKMLTFRLPLESYAEKHKEVQGCLSYSVLGLLQTKVPKSSKTLKVTAGVKERSERIYCLNAIFLLY